MIRNISFDGGDQVGDRLENPSSNPFVGHIAEPTFDQVEPGTRSRHKMLMESGMTLEPGFNLGMLMSGVIVDNQMQVQMGWALLIYQCQKLIHPDGGGDPCRFQ